MTPYRPIAASSRAINPKADSSDAPMRGAHSDVPTTVRYVFTFSSGIVGSTACSSRRTVPSTASGLPAARTCTTTWDV